MKARNKQYTELLNCTRWRNLRNTYLVSQPLCERCLQQGKTTPATEVHHIQPLENYINTPERMKALAYDPSNLQALCHACHVQVHIELKSKSKKAAKERNKQLTELFVKKFFT